jgi:LmbE family N-acetylglucosaminyl deacetylase
MIKPEIIFVPSTNDIHQDHQVIAKEGLRAFKKHTILGYEEPWNNIVFESRSFVVLERRHVEKKIKALKCYESQRHRTYLTEKAIWGIAELRGTQLEGGYAEAFEVLRWIVDK